MSFIVKGNPYGLFEKQKLTPDGVTDTFTLNFRPGLATALLVQYNGLMQEANVDYNLIEGGKKIVFTFIPTLGSNLFLIYMGRELATPSSGGGGGATSVYNTPVTGLINGSNTVFSLATNFAPGSTRIFLNGTRQQIGISQAYTETASDQITFTVAPSSGDEIYADYDLA